MQRRFGFLASLLCYSFFLLITSGCGHSDQDHTHGETHEHDHAHGADHDHGDHHGHDHADHHGHDHEGEHGHDHEAGLSWGYAANNGPTHWAHLDHSFELCGTGLAQSPVDIAGAITQNLPAIRTHYKASAAVLKNNGHTIKVTLADGGTAELGGKIYELKEFHFHAQSEHSIDGAHTAMEVHLVHADEHDKLAYIGVMLREGAANAFLEALMAAAPRHAGLAIDAKDPIDATALLPVTLDYYSYSGSLTTPSCDEGVSWFVLQEAVTISAEGLQQFTNLYQNNRRPTQPLNGRVIVASAQPN